MLGKLLKHEFKSTGKILLPLNILIIVLTIIGCILLKADVFENKALIPLAVSLLLFYTLTILAISLITTIYLIVHYYRSMFSSQGYLTFTLPTSPWTIFHSKLIMGFSWSLITAMLTCLSVLALMSSAVGFKELLSFSSDFFTLEFSFDGLINGENLSLTISELLGVSSWQVILYFIALLVVSSFSSVALGYASVTIGQLYAKHKVLGSVLAYIGLFFFLQIVNGIVGFSIGFKTAISSLHTVETSNSAISFLTSYCEMYRTLLIFTLIFSLVIGIVCYITSLPILKKKVNLD